ncbi:MAG: aminotransferase class V-fold PLP-dependent enzyme [Deltaproteobacteria bacterium]|nr:aminotransferase class V-fold PLP-dependent enzyme [Deltaproteobacteria bacterium]
MSGAEQQDPGPALSVGEARALFPGLAEMTYFATNGQALLPRPTRDRLAAGIDDLMARGFAASAALDANVERVRGQVARLLGAHQDEIAFVRNTGEGLCLIAALIDWRPGDEVLCFGGEYRSVVHAFQGMAHRGVEVRIASPQDGRVTSELVASQLRERTRVVALSWVRYDNGARADLEAIGRVLENAGVLFVVDGIQGVGVLPLDVETAGVGCLAVGAHKWLLGVSGTGILYLRRELLPSLVPSHLGVTSMEDAETLHCTGDPYRVCPVPAARQVEEGGRNALGIAALGASLDLHARIGAETIAKQVKTVTDRLCEGFRAAGGRVRSPRGAGEWSGILLLEPPPRVDPQELWGRLLRERVMVGVREGALWGGAHYYNNLDDAERLLSFL